MIPIVFAGLAAALPLLADGGLLNTRGGGDSPFLLFRLYELLANLRAGVFPARWMPDAAYGLGYPFFNYYAALPYYLAAAFKAYGLSYIASLKAVQVLGFLLAGLALYGWARRTLNSQAGAALAAVAYTFAPFHMVNVYVRGDSLSEFWAFVFYPLILWAVLRTAERPTPGRAALLAVAYAGLLLTHNISALIFTPLILLYALIHLFLVSLEHRGRRIANGRPQTTDSTSSSVVRRPSLVVCAITAGLLWGLALAAWFWLPALAEGGDVQLGEVTTGYFNYAEHFRGVDLVQPGLIFNYDTGGPGTPFAMGLVQAAFTVLGALALIAHLLRRRADGQALFILIGLVLSTFMITPLSRPLWDHLPLLPFIQFPWRFLSVQALFSALAMGALALPLASRPRLAAIGLSIPALLLAASALAGLHPEFLPLSDADVSAEQLQLYEVFTGNIGTTIRAEYLPRWTVPRPYTSPQLIHGQPAAARVLSGQAQAERLWQRPTAQVWYVQAQGAGATLAFPTLYWPGWQARVDGQPAQPRPVEHLGWIAVDVPAGEHEIRLSLGRTPLRAGAEAISALALLPALALLVRERQRLRLRPIALALPPFVLVSLILHALPVAAASPDDLTLDFAQMAYPHHNPAGVDFGPAGRLLRYEYSANAMERGEALTVTLYWAPGTESNTTITAELVSPAEHLFGAAYTLASQSQPLAPTLSFRLTPPSDVPPGLYFVRLRAQGPAGPLPAHTPGGQRRGDLYLRPVRLTPSDQAPVADCASATGPVLEAEQLTPHTLRVRLRWVMDAGPTANYVVALRLRDAAGNEWAALDTQPAYGFYPTSAWPACRAIPDRYDLTLPEGTPPGDGYQMEVKLYIAQTLAPVQQRTFPVRLPLATIKPGTPYTHRLSSDVALVRLDVPPQAQQGDALPITAAWLALDRPQRDYAALWSLRDSAGATVYSATLPLAPGSRPALWPAGALVTGRLSLRPPPTLPVGSYRLALILTDEDNAPLGASVDVGQIELVGRPRNFTVPPLAVSRGDTFGGMIRLWGYDLEREGPNLRLRLHWGAITAIAGDYTFFVHLFDPTSEHIVAQVDTQPHGGAYPTWQWAPGEVVSDDILLALGGVPPGRYRLALGWYDAATGQRLSALDANGVPHPADRVILADIVDVP